MMPFSLDIIEARIRRNMIPKKGGENYIEKDEIIAKIPFLKKFSDEEFLFGIFKNSTKWTVLSKTRIFSCNEKTPIIITLSERGREIHDFFAREGNKDASNPILKTGEEIWMKSPGMSSGFQNIMLMLQPDYSE